MYGRPRCSKTKKAVSKRRKYEADQTLRAWIHIPSGTIETNIKTISLRDKYPHLNISYLKRLQIKHLNTKLTKDGHYMWKKVSKEVYTEAKAQGIKTKIDVSNTGNGTIVDYKTTSSKSPPNKISRPYWFQQMTYAYIARKHGYEINRIRLVFVTTNEMNRYSEKTGKKLKDYPSQVSIVNHEITDLDMEIIENTLKLIAESVTLWNTKPELRYILAQDRRLKPVTKPKFFKKKE